MYLRGVSKIIWLNVVLTLLIGFSLVSKSVKAQPPVAYYAAEGNANDSSGSNHGFMVGGSSFSSGKIGQAFQLNGINQYVIVNNAPIWNFGAQPFTISLWVNFDSVRQGQLFQTSNAFMAHDNGPGRQSKWIFFYDGNGNFAFHVNSPAIGPLFFTAPIKAFPNVGRWHHIAITRSGSIYTFYFDGGSLGSITGPSVVPDSISNLTIGSAEGQGFIGGRLDEVKIFNRELSSVEVGNIAAGVSADSLVITSMRMIGPSIVRVIAEKRTSNAEFWCNVGLDIGGRKIYGTNHYLRSSDNSSTFDIDLAQQNPAIPKFDKNTVITGTSWIWTPESGWVDRKTTRNMVVFLPVVLVPGIDPFSIGESFGGNGTWKALEDYLSLQSFYVLQDRGYDVDDGVQHYTLDNSYPTISTLRYNRNNSHLPLAAASLKAHIDTILDKTWASKVAIVGHSKGGLVARQYLANYGGGKAARLFMAQSPHLGSLWPVIGQGLLGWDYQNLWPLWPAQRRNPSQPFSPYSNDELRRLNQIRLPDGPTYYILFSRDASTPETYTSNKYVSDRTYTDGDSIVPWFSQRGIQYNPNYPVGPSPLMPAFFGVDIKLIELTGIHSGFMDMQSTQQAILDLLMNDL